MKSLIILLFAALCSKTTVAQKGADIPAPAKAAFAKSYGGASKAKWDKENDQYEVSFQYKSQKMSVLYTASGSIVETETKIAVDALPQAAQQYASAKGKIKDAARIVLADGSIQYEAEVKGTDLLFNDKGVFLTERKEKD